MALVSLKKFDPSEVLARRADASTLMWRLRSEAGAGSSVGGDEGGESYGAWIGSGFFDGKCTFRYGALCLSSTWIFLEQQNCSLALSLPHIPKHFRHQACSSPTRHDLPKEKVQFCAHVKWLFKNWIGISFSTLGSVRGKRTQPLRTFWHFQRYCGVLAQTNRFNIPIDKRRTWVFAKTSEMVIGHEFMPKNLEMLLGHWKQIQLLSVTWNYFPAAGNVLLNTGNNKYFTRLHWSMQRCQEKIYGLYLSRYPKSLSGCSNIICPRNFLHPRWQPKTRQLLPVWPIQGSFQHCVQSHSSWTKHQAELLQNFKNLPIWTQSKPYKSWRSL